ncbi:hypothetical protein BGW41_000205 [Actinomortierella wolfii]|nr:hypothetical protein BGW41_000205 [Actinomortierella wolfii]
MWLTSTNLLALVQSFRHLRSLEIHVVSSSTAGYGMTFSSGKTRPRLIEGLPLALFDNAVLGSLPCLERLDISADQVILNDEESFEGEGAKNTNSSTAARSHCSPKNQFATKAITSKQPLINVERLLLACPRLEMLSLRGPVFSLREEESRGIGSPGISVTLSSHPINRPHDHPRIECNSSPSSTGLVTRFLRSVRLRDIGDVTEADLLRFLTRYGTRIDELDLTGSVCWPWSECFPTTFARACPRLRTLTFNCTNVPFYNSTNLSAHTAHQSPPLHSSSVQQQQQGNSSVQVNRPALMKTALSDDQLADILCALSLSAPLDSSVPTQLHSFTARSCYIGAKALKALEKACSPELRVLDLSMARKIPPDTVGQELHSFLRRNAPALERLDAEGMHIQLLDLVPECDSDDDVDDDDDDDDKENQVIEQGVEHQEKKVEPNKGGSGRRWQWACHQSLESLTIGFSTPVGSDVEPTEEDVADGQTVVFPTVDRQQDAAWRFLASLRRLKHLKIAYSQLNFSLDTLVDEFGRLCKHKDEQILYEPECSFTPPTPPYETKMSSLRGLARLASLTELETLDLETCTLLNSQNQSMELSCRELSWMGQVWPRLRVLRLPERYNRHEKQFQSWFLYGRRLRLAQHHSSSHPQQQRSGQDVDDPVIQILCPLTWSASW